MTQTFASIAVVGAGAVGSYYGAMLARAGTRVTLIGREAHVHAIERDGLRLETDAGREVVRVAASTAVDAVRGAGLVLFCVKSTDTAAVARQIAPHLAPGAVLLSLQNGVENAATIEHETQRTVVPAAVYVATAMDGPGVVRHHGGGELVIGPPGADNMPQAMADTLDAITALFAAAQVPVRRCADVRVELWGKLLVNCAYNAISALAQQPYGRMVALPEIRETQRAVVHEVVAVARAEGVPLELQASLDAAERIATLMPGQRSSTAQDLARGKPTEIDHLNGFVARRGRELGVAVPVNQALHALVRLVEATRDAAQPPA